MIVAVTGAIKGTSKEKFCDELGLESPQLRRWSRKLCYFYKFYRHETPQYLFQLIPLRRSSYTARNTENIPLFKQNITFSKIPFQPQLLSSGTVLTITLAMSEALVILKTIS